MSAFPQRLNQDNLSSTLEGAFPQRLNQDNLSSTLEGTWFNMSSCSQETHAHFSNKKEKAQLLPETSTLESCRVEKSDV